MTATTERVMNRAGNGKYLTPLLQSQARRNQRAASYRRFHHQSAHREAAYDAVASGEVPLQRGRSGGIFGHQCALAGKQGIRQTLMPTPVDSVTPRTQHRYGGP